MTGSSVLHYLLGFAQIHVESVMLRNHLTFCCPLLLLPSIFPSISVFSIELALRIRWSKYWSLSSAVVLSINILGLFPWGLVWSPCSPRDSQESSPAPQFESISSSALSLLYAYITTGKTIGLTIWTLAGKMVSLLFNMLSRFIVAFLPRSKCLLISWLQSPFAVILEPKKIKSVTVSIVSPSICHEVMELDAMIFIFWMLSFKPVFFTLFFHFHQEAL